MRTTASRVHTYTALLRASGTTITKSWVLTLPGLHWLALWQRSRFSSAAVTSGPLFAHMFWAVLYKIIIAFSVAMQTHITHVLYMHMQRSDQVGCACQKARMTLGSREVCFQSCSVISMVWACAALSVVHDPIVTMHYAFTYYVFHNGTCQCFPKKWPRYRQCVICVLCSEW